MYFIRRVVLLLQKAQQIWTSIRNSVANNFRHATLNFLFIILFVNLFQRIFGPENSIVGVIFTIMMSASMARDLTATPVKHLCIQGAVLVLMAAAACFVSNTPPLLALPVNLAMLCLILYAFTYEYVNQLYFPYILSYLFLVFISPITPDQLPKRLLGMLTGAVCIILYQLINGRNRVVETARDVVVSMCGKATGCIDCLLSGKGVPQDPEALRQDLCKLSKIVYDRRRKALCISDASFSMLDTGRGLENLVILLYELEGPVTAARAALLRQVSRQLSHFKSFMLGEASSLPPLDPAGFTIPDDAQTDRFYPCLSYIRSHMLQMTLPEKRSSYHKTLLSFSVRLKAALNVSPVRVAYALRVSCLLALATLAVQALQLPHGKWLLFTLASVSLPYADDVGTKAKKRLAATVIGGIAGVVLYSLIPSAAGRTAVMMLSGYLSFYFTDYAVTFACSTLGALGGAVFAGAFGWASVGSVLLIRLGYILLGIGIALLANCVLFPFKRKKATGQLWEKYVATTGLLTRVCRAEQTDPQLYYSLVIQAHLLEDKLAQNAKDLNWEDAGDRLEACRKAVRLAHRRVAANQI